MSAATAHAFADFAASRRRTVITPEGIALPFVVATRSARFGALVLDYAILLFTTVAVTLLLSWIAGGVGGITGEGRGGASEFLEVVWTLFWFLAWNGYFIAFELSPRGATPGKRAAKIRVAARPADWDQGGDRLTAEAVFARNLLRDIELFMPIVFLIKAPSGAMGAAGIAGALWFLVFVLFPFFNRDGLRAGDLVAGTWVVEAPRAQLPKAMSVDGIGAGPPSDRYRFGEAELAVYGEYELQTLERVLRENRKEAIESVQRAICAKIGWNPGTGEERAFLEAYYAQLRARLEGGMRFGKRKADKFSAG